jgi:hypothetical protein
MLAGDFAERVAKRPQEVRVGLDDRAVELELDNGLRFSDRLDLARQMAFFSFCAVTSVANLTTPNDLPFSSSTGL